MATKEYVFKTSHDKMHFVGNFDALYKDESDPWGQSGHDERMGDYYNQSRSGLIEIMNTFLEKNDTILEVGSGLGYVVDYFNKQTSFTVEGADISSVAIKKSNKLFPSHTFYQLDITASNFTPSKSYDAVILNQILWYILEGGSGLKSVFANASVLLKEKSHLIICNAFIEEQKYGKDIIDGFGGLITHITNQQNRTFQLKHALYYKKKDMLYHDGVVVLQKV